MRTQEILGTHPKKSILAQSELAACINACDAAADACTSCADSCLGEEMVQELVRCIRLNLDCADICQVTGRLIARQTESDFRILRVQVEACAAACRACAEECDRHAKMHEHCRICAAACHACEDECRKLLHNIPSTAAAH